MTTGQLWVAQTMLFTGALAGINTLRHLGAHRHTKRRPPIFDWQADPVLRARLTGPTVRRVRTVPPASGLTRNTA